MIKKLIDRFKNRRTMAHLQERCAGRYAFVGMGQHSLTNLYPVLDYMRVPLKYICVTNADKARLIGLKYAPVVATTSLAEVLADKDVKGVMVAASPSAHFAIASQVIESCKALFIEKPPCATSNQLEQLIELQERRGAVVSVGLQKRYAPSVGVLQKRLAKDKAMSYVMRYVTGAYPEGDALTDIYIHALDLVTYLFGRATVVASKPTGHNSYMVMLRHGDTIGSLELSTAYTWSTANENLSVCTSKGVYELSQMEQLTFMRRQPVVCGVPLEKVLRTNPTVEYLYGRNNFVPTVVNNQIYSQGFYNECKAWVDLVEGRSSLNLSPLQSLRDTFRLIDDIQSF